MVFGSFKRVLVRAPSIFNIVLLLFLALVSNATFSQELEETIYTSLESFVANPSLDKLQELQIKETSYAIKVASHDEQLALLSLQCNLGYYFNRFEKTLEAIGYYESAWRTYELNQLNSYDISEFCLKPLGNLYTKTGAFTNAENTIKQYIFYAEQENNQTQKVSGILNLSVVYNNTGNQKTAISLLKNALQTPSISSKQKTALENNLVSNLFAIGDFEEAQELIDKVIASGRNISVNVYKNAAQLALQKKEYEKALSYFHLAEKALFRSENFSARDLAKLYEEKSQLYLIQKKNSEAEASLKAALQVLLPYLKEGQAPQESELYPENTLAAIFDGLALLQSNDENALTYYDLSFYVSDLLASHLNAQEAKTLHQLDDRKRSEKCVALLQSMFLKTQEVNYLERAFNYAERSKAVVLAEMHTKQSVLASNPNDQDLIKEKELSRKQETLINELVRAQLSNTNLVDQNRITEALNGLNLEMKAVKNKILEKSPATKNTIVSLQEIQTKLAEDKALMLYFFFGNESLYHFNISENEIRLVEKPRSEKFMKSISDFIGFFDNASLINNDISNFTAASAALFDELELSKYSKRQNLVIVPDGLLNFIPFEALLTKETSTLQFSEMPFLVKSHSLVYNTTASFYAASSVNENENELLGVFPVFEGTTKELRYSINEAEAIQDEISSSILFKKEATKAKFLAEAHNYNILHLSTHASGGDFTFPAHIEFIDDVMLLHELYSLDLNPKLVVLSACETGIGKLQKGEGAMSVARGFQYAGAKNLLFSLWKVNDLSTSQLMASFYEGFGKTEFAFEANHQSKIEYLNNDKINNSKKSPYYWSSFVYYGELSEVKNGFNWYLLILILPLLLLLYWRFRKRN